MTADYDEQDTADVGWEDDAYDAWLSERLGEPTPPVSADAAYEVAQAAGRDADRGFEPPERLDADRGPVVLYDQFAGVHGIEGARFGREAADTPEFEYRVEAKDNRRTKWYVWHVMGRDEERARRYLVQYWDDIAYENKYRPGIRFRLMRQLVVPEPAWEQVPESPNFDGRAEG